MHKAYDHLAAVLLRVRLQLVVRSLQWRARWHRSELECHVDPDVRLGRRVRISVEPGTRNVLRIEQGSRIWDDVRIELRGGSLLIAAGADIKTRCVLGVGGVLRLEGANLLQHGCIVHCDEAVTLEEHAVLAEYVTVIDSSHVLGGPAGQWLHRVKTSPVVIGRNAWICAKATVARGVRVGPDAVVAANSLVLDDVPAGYLMSGVPAQKVRWLAAGDGDRPVPSGARLSELARPS